MKNILFLLLISLGDFAYSQHILEWSYEFDFSIDKTDLPYKLDSINFFFNNSKSYGYYKKGKLIYNPDSNQYNIKLNFNCLGCIEKEPHELYFMLHFDEKVYDKKFTTIIPIYFEPVENSLIKYDLKTIKLLDFIYEYEMIEVKSDHSINKRKANEFKCRRMDKLIKIE